MKPTLHDDSFADTAVAQAACILCETDYGITNAIALLIRPLDVRGDESGNHPGESFVMARLTREELREMVAWLDEDWAAQVAVTPDIVTANAKVRGAGTASAGLPGYTAGDNTE